MAHYHRLAVAALLTVMTFGFGSLHASAEEESPAQIVLATEAATEPTENTQVTESMEETADPAEETEPETTAATEAATELTKNIQVTESSEETADPTEAPATEATIPQAEQSGSWEVRNGKRFYVFADGTNAVGEMEIDGIPYLFARNGAQKTDWQTVGGNRYYYDPFTGAFTTGWLDYFGSRYYISEDGKVTGLDEIEDSVCQFDAQGALISDHLQDTLVNTDEGIFLVNEEGNLVSGGWCELQDGRRYYADPDTSTLSFGLVDVDGDAYYITEENGLTHGAVKVDGAVYVFSQADGTAVSSWYQANKTYYYFDAETMTNRTGFTEINGKHYYLAEDDGHMWIGWLEKDAQRYYFGANGVQYFGLQQIDDAFFYFYEDGTLAADAWVTLEDGVHYFQASGTMAVGVSSIGDTRYLFGTDGVLSGAGLTELDGNTYLCREDGSLVTSETVTIDDYHYTFGEDGVLISKLSTAAVLLDVVSFKQFDTTWGSVALGNSTIKSIGCLLTSMSMLQSYKTGTVITPPTMKKMLTFTTGGALASWKEIEGKGYTVETYNGGMGQSLMQHMYEQLLRGTPIMFGSKKSNGSQHYVVVTGYIGDAKFFETDHFVINDPGSSWNTILTEHLLKYPILYKLVY